MMRAGFCGGLAPNWEPGRVGEVEEVAATLEDDEDEVEVAVAAETDEELREAVALDVIDSVDSEMVGPSLSSSSSPVKRW